MPSLPRLDWDGFRWTGSLVLPAWAGYQSSLGADNGPDPSALSDGTFALSIVNPSKKIPPSTEQIAAYNYLLAHQEAIRDAMIGALLTVYPEWQPQYGYEGEEKQEYMPDIESADDFRSLICPSAIQILGVTKEGYAYVGFEFGCTWDDEHGLGFMTHQHRVIEMGGADIALLEWIAENDAEKN